ncbi:MAG: PH domain-containing protein [Candidatus Thorarchaeota archaeon]
MGREYEYDSKVIKPPVESMSGKVIKPSKAMRNKYWFEAIVSAVSIWLVVIITFFGIFYLIGESIGVGYEYFTAIYWEPVNLIYWIATAIWIIPALVLIPIYLNSFEYSVRTKEGDSLPEIVTKKGILTITHKHVPLRSITNVSTRAGVLDRLFKIGNVEIETAGFSGITQEGPEEKIQGITFYNELRDYILAEMRKFKDPYVLGTEVSSSFEEPVARMDGSLDDEILITLREMRELLRNIDRKLDNGGK